MRGASLPFAAAVLSASVAGAVAAGAFELPPGPGRELVYGQCRTCHDLQYIVDSAGIPADEWAAAVDNMRQYGLRVPADQRAKIVKYLATYLGPSPPPKPAEPAAPAEAAPADGAAVYAEQCAACHQPTGKGVPGQFPPLAGNRDLYLDRTYPVVVVLNGLEGRIEVAGKRFEGAMPPFDFLSDATVAAVVSYIRKSWGNAAMRPAGWTEVDAAAVKAARAKRLTPDAVLALRARLR